ncbi:Transcription initiation factor TFIID subunit 11 [Quillaja saponaria]|uniref:Transcription initiation factor TFIID subunit 11 n=1 Tax=Quillaja saponaria TaxID=32244 RepID=A0AAD7PG95_QUISA|nr:Transcription initiation factor TFIID subunit 11 [Quillaja saponaria]
MKQSKDPFEAAFEEQEESPLEPPPHALEMQNASATAAVVTSSTQAVTFQSAGPSSVATATTAIANTATKNKDDDDEEEEEENMDVELGKFPSSGDPDKLAKMQSMLSQFTEEQMSRYESFRRAGFQKANMKRLLASITGTQKISVPMTIVVSGIAKMFVGELVETARLVMTERKQSGPIRPSHFREAYRRLKLEGKVFRRSVPRLFR